MTDRRWKLGICGTFDVANYGDLLFPLIAEAELSDRLGEVTLHRFSYHSKAPPDWPYEVTSVAELPQMIDDLDGLLIGGGFLIRFDKTVAPGYVPPSPEIHHPTGYWLAPALMAVQHNVPLVWNAPGAHVDGIPQWAKPLVAAALSLSGYVAVRDEGSRAVLQGLDSAPIAVVPDTAFTLPRLLNLEAGPSAEFTRLREACGLDRPYIAVQSIHHLAPFVKFVKANRKQFENFRFLALPIGPVLGDDDATIADLPGVVRLDEWPHPLLIAELIGRAEAVVGDSFHLCATAAVFGVPAFRRSNVWMGKYSALRRFPTIHELPPGQSPALEWFMSRLGRTTACEEARAACRALHGHWNRIAQVFQGERTQTTAALDRFWQSIPGRLESMANREDREAIASKNSNDLGSQLKTARTEIAERDTRIAEIQGSLSWRLTAPLRAAGRLARKIPETARDRSG